MKMLGGSGSPAAYEHGHEMLAVLVLHVERIMQYLEGRGSFASGSAMEKARVVQWLLRAKSVLANLTYKATKSP